MRIICLSIFFGLALGAAQASSLDDGCWMISPTKSAPSGVSSFYNIAVIGPNDVWAAGSNGELSVQDPLLEHWDGHEWTIFPTPPVRVAKVLAQGIAGVATNDVWMVGGTTSNDIPFQTVTEHWNGTQWSLVASPNPPTGVHGSMLRSVTCTSTSNCWAVGWTRSSELYQTLIEHWDGTQWSIVSSPEPGAQNNLLHCVKARAPNDVWAVGWAPVGEGDPPVAFHWDGTQWNNIPVPAIGPCYNVLNGIVSVAPNDVWAVGWTTLSDCSTYRPLLLHWNGTQWNNAANPVSDYDNYALYSIKALASNDVWAVGDANGTPLAMHWDGTAWNLVTAEQPTKADFFWAMDAVAPNEIWAVGIDTTLAERFTAPCGLPSPTPTPTPTPTPMPIQSVACDPPGVTVLNDDPNDSAVSQPEYEIERVSIAEPAFIGPGKIMFVIKMAELANLPGSTIWSLIFKAPNGSDFFVRMETGPSGTATGSTVSYHSGPGTDPVSNTDIKRADEALSTYSVDGTIQIVVRRSDIGNPGIGEQLTQFFSEVQIPMSASPFIRDTAPSDGSRAGSYTVVGSERCPATENACAEPGKTILLDPEADPSDKQVGHDVTSVSISEPPDLPNKLLFTLKVKSLATVPPDTRWPLRFVAPNGIDYTVRMTNSTTDGVTIAPLFQVGTTAQTLSGTAQLPAADPASSFDADGTIRIVVPASAIGHPIPGQKFSDFNVRVAANLVGNTYTPDNVPDNVLFPSGATYTFGGNALCQAVPVTIVSRKTHGLAGTYDVDLAKSEIECRSGGASSDYRIIFTFADPLTSVGGANITSGTGTVSNGAIGSDPHQYVVDLTGVGNAQTISVRLTNVADETGRFNPALSTSMRLLVGDTSGDGVVNSADIAQTKSQSGQSVSGSNFREDVTADGNINSADIALVKSKSGTGLP